MTAQAIFPLALWAEGTNQASTPANDNALRIQALMGPALGTSNTLPTVPHDYDQYLVGTPWGGMSTGSVAIYLGGTWREFATYDGMVKPVGGVPYVKHAGAWAPLTGS